MAFHRIVYTVLVLIALERHHINGVTPPLFTHEPSDSIGKKVERNLITLSCTATGTTPITFTWIKTSLKRVIQDFSSDSRYTVHSDGRLVISNPNYNKDDGYYHCVATNSAGTRISKRAKLRIPYFVDKSGNSPVYEAPTQGNPWRSNFPATESFPEPVYSWTKNNGPVLQEDERVSISKGGQLFIANVQTNDVGTYKSSVSNAATGGSYNRSPISLSVRTNQGNVNAVISLRPVDQYAIEGKTTEVVFECFASGRPMPVISWKKNGNTLSSSSKFSFTNHNKRLKVINPGKADEGTYSCHITNQPTASAAKAEAKLIVEIIPSFTAKPANEVEMFVSRTARFPCNTTGFPAAKTVWYHNGRTVVSSTSELTLRNLQPSDGGFYQCFATNDAGQSIATTYLKLKNIPLYINTPPKNTVAIVGETVELKCVASGTPTPSVMWRVTNKDGSKDVDVTSSSSRFRKKSTGALQVTNGMREDSGTYTCVTRNTEGSKNASAELKILIRTVISSPLPSEIKAKKGLKKILPCGVTKDPLVTVQFFWTKDGVAIDTVRMSVLSNGSLQIAVVRDEDVGTYKCEVKSTAGNGTTSGRLIVQESPYSPTTPVVTERQTKQMRLTWSPPGYDGNSAIINYHVEAMRKSEDWKIVNDNINPSSSQVSVVVRNLAPNSEYRFRVRAVNAVGVGAASSPTAYYKTLIAAPSAPPGDVRGYPVNAQSFMVQWKIPDPSTHNGPLTGFDVDYRIAAYQSGSYTTKTAQGSTATQITIDDLIMFTEYEYRVRAVNSAAPGPFSQPKRVTTGEGAPSAPPQNVQVVSITSTSVKLQWKPPPQKQQNGRIQSYLLEAVEPGSSSSASKVSTVQSHNSQSIMQEGEIKELKKFTQYQVKITAKNSAAFSPASDPVLVKTSEGVPDAPRSFTVSELYSDTLRVSWLQPAEINGVLKNYRVRYWRNDSRPSTASEISVSNISTSAVITGLSPRTLYTVEVAAVTRVGPGTALRLVAKTLSSPEKPKSPSQILVEKVESRSVFLRWTVGSTGRAPIITYTIDYNNESNYRPETATWKTAFVVRDAHKLYPLFPLEVPNLKPYAEYRFRVTATNKVGSSPPSNASGTVRTAEDIPSAAPQGLTASADADKKGQLELKWKIPAQETWNSASVGYEIVLEPQMESATGHIQTARIPKSNLDYYNAGGLLGHTNYKITVRLYNSKGSSNKSAVIYHWTTEGVPDKPPSQVFALATSARKIYVSWSPVPVDGRNGAVIGYKIFYRALNRVGSGKVESFPSGNTLSATISSLEPFVTYEFKVLAYTKQGPGPYSKAVTARTKESSPGPPVRLRFSEVSSVELKLVWDPPVNPHGNITGYDLRWYHESATSFDNTFQLPASARDFRTYVTQSWKRYVFEVRARTKMGEGSWARAAVYATDERRDAPNAPFISPIPDSAVSTRSVEISWRVSSDGNSPLRYFTLQFNMNNGGWVTYSSSLDSTLRTLLVEGLLPGTRYKFRLRVANDIGDSPYSGDSSWVTTRAEAPTGAPRNVVITAASTNSLLIEWACECLLYSNEPVGVWHCNAARHNQEGAWPAENSVIKINSLDPLPDELGGTLQGFHLQYRRLGTSKYLKVTLGSDVHKYTLTGLEVFTTYEVKIAAYNEKGSGKSTPPYRSTTAELAPTQPPKEVKKGKVSQTSVQISWKPPSAESIKGKLGGFKIYYEEQTPAARRRRRRKRDVDDDGCPKKKGPNFVDVAPSKTEETLKHLRMYMKYKITIRAYNSKGESPPSDPIYAQTLSGIPGPPASFGPVYNGVYNDQVHVYWHGPCEPNDAIDGYQMRYGLKGKDQSGEMFFRPTERTYKITGLQMLTSYWFKLRARGKQNGYGPSFTFFAETKGPARAPARPGKPLVQAGSVEATVRWINGDSGNVPFLKFEIQGKTSGSSNYERKWEASPGSVGRNKSSAYVYYTVGNLQPSTSYRFRIIAWNSVGKSPASPPSEEIVTLPGDPLASGHQAVYKETWFISLVVVLGILLIVVIVGFVFVCVRQKKAGRGHSTTHSSRFSGSASAHSTLEMIRSEQNRSRSHIVRNGSLPVLQITYGDPGTDNEDDVVSSLDSKPEISESDLEDESGVETIPEKSGFAEHYKNDPLHQSWRNSLGRQHRTTAHNRLDPTTEDSDVPDDIPNQKRFSSFSPDPPGYHPDVPPTYEESHVPRNDVAHLDYLPEAVTSFMSSGYGSRSRSNPNVAQPYPPEDRPDVVPNRGYQTLDLKHLGAGRARPDRKYASRDSIDELPRRYGSRDELDGPAKRVRSRERFGVRSSPHQSQSSQNHGAAPRNSSFRRALLDRDGPFRGSDASSSRSSSSGEHKEPRSYPRVKYDEEPGRRRRNRPHKLEPFSKLPSRERNPPQSPLAASPAPSYRSTDNHTQAHTYEQDRFSFPSTSQRSRDPVYQSNEPRWKENPRKVPADWGQEGSGQNDVQMSSYQSFV